CRRRTKSCVRERDARSRSRPAPRRTRSRMQSQPQTATRRWRSSRCSPASTRKRHGLGSPRRVVSSARRSQMSWVEAELREQPVALERFLTAESAHTPGIVRALLRDDIRYLLIVSRGSSSNVARYMQYLFGTVNRLPVAFATPSLYTVYDAPPEL